MAYCHSSKIFMTLLRGKKNMRKRGTFLHLSDTNDSIPREQVVRGAGRGKKSEDQSEVELQVGYENRRMRAAR